MIAGRSDLPDWPYGSLMLILFAEAAAAFEELTLSGQDDQLKAQVPDAWPNLFREARFLSAVDFVQADRLRRKVATEMARIFSQVDVLLVPSLRDEMLTISNFTGHPSLTLRAGFVEVARGAQRLGARPGASAAQVLAAATRAARRHADRASVRRRHGRARGARARANVCRRRRAAAGLLSERRGESGPTSRPAPASRARSGSETCGRPCPTPPVRTHGQSSRSRREWQRQLTPPPVPSPSGPSRLPPAASAPRA